MPGRGSFEGAAVATYQEFRQGQCAIELDGLSYMLLRIAYTDVGEGDPIILLHGIPTWSYLYHDVIPLLKPRCRVIAPDFLGHGYSDRRDRFDRSLVAQTRMVLRLMDHLGIDAATIVGHDTGGGVGLIMGVEHGERVRRLVLCNAVAYDSWPAEDMIALSNPEWRSKRPRDITEWVLSGLAPGLHNPARLTPAFREGIVAPYQDEEGKISLIRNASALNTCHTMALVDRHSEIAAPTLLLWGAQDPWQTVADADRLATEIPGARLVRMENASHWLQQDDPQTFARELLAFMSVS
jgi:haloalkane dehalogenase